jgi:hypothetical protein
VRGVTGALQRAVDEVVEAHVQGAGVPVAEAKLRETRPENAPVGGEDAGADGLDCGEAEEDLQEEIIRTELMRSLPTPPGLCSGQAFTSELPSSTMIMDQGYLDLGIWRMED